MEFEGICSVEKHSRFTRELKKLKKRFRTLEDDLDNFINTSVRAVHLYGTPPESLGHFEIQGLYDETEGYFIAKKFTCKSLKGKGVRTGIRVVYHFEKQNLHLLLIELFHKQDKSTPDLDRIRALIENRLNIDMRK
ncbi:MAG: hypothetical protein GQ565_01935 [Candidatus Aegiribacteria sp.]|nr:hypothetical protein [Candidatus Aegiribacteria sp.]